MLYSKLTLWGPSMSVISLLVFKPERLPSIESLQAEAASGGEPIEVGSDVDLRSHNGYLPLRAFDRDTGFEFYFEAVPRGELLDRYHRTIEVNRRDGRRYSARWRSPICKLPCPEVRLNAKLICQST